MEAATYDTRRRGIINMTCKTTFSDNFCCRRLFYIIWSFLPTPKLLKLQTVRQNGLIQNDKQPPSPTTPNHRRNTRWLRATCETTITMLRRNGKFPPKKPPTKECRKRFYSTWEIIDVSALIKGLTYRVGYITGGSPKLRGEG